MGRAYGDAAPAPPLRGAFALPILVNYGDSVVGVRGVRGDINEQYSTGEGVLYLCGWVSILGDVLCHQFYDFLAVMRGTIVAAFGGGRKKLIENELILSHCRSAARTNVAE